MTICSNVEISENDLKLLCEKGKTKAEIASLYETSPYIVGKFLKKYGLSRSRRTQYEIGDIYGDRVIIGSANPGPRGDTRVKVRCKCGHEDEVYLNNLIHGKAKTCKHCKGRLEYRLGDKYGYRTIIGGAKPNENGQTMVAVQCDCGHIDIVSLCKLMHGESHMCYRCFILYATSKRPNLGVTQEPWYCVWESMFTRCYNPKNINYHNYGGRGITVCDEWRDSSKFGEWAMSHGYEKGLQIDRIDVNGNYEPSNCRWVTAQVNNNNRRNNVLVTVDGITDTFSNTCRRYNLKRYNVSSYKYKHDVSYEEAIEHYRQGNTDRVVRLTYNGETHTITEWSKILGISRKTIYNRYNLGYSVDNILYKGNLTIKLPKCEHAGRRKHEKQSY